MTHMSPRQHGPIQHNTYVALHIHSTIHMPHYTYTAQYMSIITNTQHNILCCITQYRCMTHLSRSAPHNTAQYICSIMHTQHNTCAALYIHSTIWYNTDPASHRPHIIQYNIYTVGHAHSIIYYTPIHGTEIHHKYNHTLYCNTPCTKYTIYNTAQYAQYTIHKIVPRTKYAIYNTISYTEQTIHNTTSYTKYTTYNTASYAQHTIHNIVPRAKYAIYNTISHTEHTIHYTISYTKHTIYKTLQYIRNRKATVLCKERPYIFKHLLMALCQAT